MLFLLQAAAKCSDRPETSNNQVIGSHPKSLHFQFYRNPVEVIVDPMTGAASGLRVEITALKQGPHGQAVAVGTGRPAYAHLSTGDGRAGNHLANSLDASHDAPWLGQFEIIAAQLILVSIGYKSLSVPGLPFDARSGTVPNQKGKVLSPLRVGGGQYS